MVYRVDYVTSMLTGLSYPEYLGDGCLPRQGTGSHRTQGDNHLELGHGLDLLDQVGDTRLHLLGCWYPVIGGPTATGVGQSPLQSHLLKGIGEEHPRPTHEGLTLYILIHTGSLTYEEDLIGLPPPARYAYRSPSLVQGTEGTSHLSVSMEWMSLSFWTSTTWVRSLFPVQGLSPVQALSQPTKSTVCTTPLFRWYRCISIPSNLE